MMLLTSIAPLVLAATLDSNLRWGATEADGRNADEHLRYSVARFQSLVQERNVLKPWLPTGQQGMFVGSGFCVRYDEEGPLIVTNAHVINDAIAVVLQVPALGEEQFPVKVVLVNHDQDIALVRLADEDAVQAFRVHADEKTFKPVQLHEGQAQQGMEVTALGFPLGKTSVALTSGIISGSNEIGGFLSTQTTAQISPGNSGGPLFLTGTDQVIGINYASLEGEGSEQNNFVVPAYRVRQMVAAYDREAEAGNSTEDEPILGQYKKSACSESREMCTVKVPQLAAEMIPSTEAMYAHYGCEAGVFASKVLPHSLLATADPPVESKSFITKVGDIELDRFGFGKGAEDENLAGFYDLLYMQKDLTQPAEVESCSCGKITKHAVTLTWQKANEPPIPSIDEPSFATMDFEQFGSLTIAPLTMNAVKALVGEGAMQLVPYVTDPSHMKPALLITDVEQGSEASTEVGTGALVGDVNGKTVSTLAELRENFQPSTQVTCKAQEDEQFSKASQQQEGAEMEAPHESPANALLKVLQSNQTNGWELTTREGDKVIEDFRVSLILQAQKIRMGAAPVTPGVEKALTKFAEEMELASTKEPAPHSTSTSTATEGEDDGEDVSLPADPTPEPASSLAPAPSPSPVSSDEKPAVKALKKPLSGKDILAAIKKMAHAAEPVEARRGVRRGGALYSPM